MLILCKFTLIFVFNIYMVLIIFMKKSLFIVSLQEMTFINLVLYTDGTYIIVLCLPFCNSAQYIF